MVRFIIGVIFFGLGAVYLLLLTNVIISPTPESNLGMFIDFCGGLLAFIAGLIGAIALAIKGIILVVEGVKG